MYLDAWLPREYLLPDGSEFRHVLSASLNWQIISTDHGSALIANVELLNKWEAASLIFMQLRFTFAGKEYGFFASPIGKQLTPLDSAISPRSLDEVCSFITAYSETRSLNAEIALSDGIYVEGAKRILPTFTANSNFSDDLVIGQWLCAGLNISIKNTSRVKEAAGWLSDSDIFFIQEKCGFTGSHLDIDGNVKQLRCSIRTTETRISFRLPGRSALEHFFNEHVVDIIQNPLPYAAMGINFPASIVLYGPPGCGKTHAAESLIKYLGWMQFHVNASSVASPYIHETSKKISDVFSKAISNAPSAIIIDEMESFLSDRSLSSDNHHIEEIAEFLRRIPEARDNRVLIIGMTNRPDMIDPAILRRGRFDHVIEVGYASGEEICDLLKSLLEKLPVDDNIGLEVLAQELAGRPLSDVAFIVREGARLAARHGSMTLSEAHLYQAKEALIMR